VALQPDEQEPLEISIDPSGGYGFWVNAPAYVAMFDIVPGSGINLLYPRTSFDVAHSVRAGTSYVHGSFSFHRSGLFVESRLSQPHYIVAIASRQPLNIRQPVGYSDWITYKLGMAAFAGTSLEIMNGVFQEVVPPQPAGDWATAVYVVFPGVPWRQNIYQLVRCPDGYTYVVNLTTPVFICPAPRAPDSSANRPANDEGGRRKEPPRAKGGSSIARANRGTDLGFLQIMNNTLYRPTTQSGRRAYTPGTFSGDARGLRTVDGGYTSYHPGTQSVENPVANRPQIEAPPPSPPPVQSQAPPPRSAEGAGSRGAAKDP
jgi:hypothetical protein